MQTTRLPKRPATGAPAGPLPVPAHGHAGAAPGGRPRLLLIEDDPQLAEAECAALDAAGYDVWPASRDTPPEQLFEAGPPDFAVVAASARAFEASGLADRLVAAGIPFVLTAAANDTTLVQRAIDAGAIGCFFEPLDLPAVAPAIAVWIARAAEGRRLAEHERALRSALKASRCVGTAVGILMERRGVTAEQAFESLRRQARSQRASVRELAARFVAESGAAARQPAAAPPSDTTR